MDILTLCVNSPLHAVLKHRRLFCKVRYQEICPSFQGGPPALLPPPPVCNRCQSQTKTWLSLQLKYIKAIIENLQCSVKRSLTTFFPSVLNVPFAWGLLVSQSNAHTHTHSILSQFPPVQCPFLAVFSFVSAVLLLLESELAFPPCRSRLCFSQTDTNAHIRADTQTVLFPIYGVSSLAQNWVSSKHTGALHQIQNTQYSDDSAIRDKYSVYVCKEGWAHCEAQQ